MTRTEELEQQLKELDPKIEGEEYEGKRDGILAELEAEGKHQHEWNIVDMGNIVMVKCECGLSVEIYPDHVSLWNYKGKVGLRLIDSIRLDKLDS